MIIMFITVMIIITLSSSLYVSHHVIFADNIIIIVICSSCYRVINKWSLPLQQNEDVQAVSWGGTAVLRCPPGQALL